MERLLAPLPASRADARREIEPPLDGVVLSRRRANSLPQLDNASGREDGRPACPGMTPDLASEVEGLLAEARDGFAGAPLDFTLVAIPAGRDPEGSGARFNRCEDDSPDAGEIREGVFYWPFRSFQALGEPSIGEVGRFAFMSFDRDGKASKAFSEFCGRAAAALLASAPSWIDIRRPGPGLTT